MIDEAEIHRKSRSRKVSEREEAAHVLAIDFAGLSDKVKAWDDLIRLTSDIYSSVRRSAAVALGSAFSHVPEKKHTWDDLHKLTQEKDNFVRCNAANALGASYSHIPEEDKKQAMEDLHRLTEDINASVRMEVAIALGASYSHLPEEYKKQARDDLHRLTQDKDGCVGGAATDALGVSYSHIPEKYMKQARDDLHRLTQEKDNSVRGSAANALGASYSHIPKEEKKQAWDDLHRLTKDKDNFVQGSAANALGASYFHIPEEYKEQARNDLHRLTRNKNDFVRRNAASALGASYSHIPKEYKKQAWEDLIKLASDTDSDVKVAANHSSGKVCILRATEAESEDYFRNEIEKAMEYFEKSALKATYYNPASFCLPFYRSFHALIFKKEEAEAEVQKYLSEAKSTVEGSKNKGKLIEVVENLGNALKEVQKARDFNEKKSDLNAYRRYCDRACELLDTTEDKAPGASRLIRRGLPIIDERIKGIIAEIQEKAKALCKQVKDTEFKEIGQQINIVGQELSRVVNPIRIEKEVTRMLIPLSAICKKMPEEDRGEACEILKQINDEQNVEDKLPLINMFLSMISIQMSKVTSLEKEISKKTSMSPIELFFHEKQDTINELAKKFSTYLNRRPVITEEVIKVWLLQFGNITRIKFALRLLENIDYYEPQQMKEIFKHFYEKIIDKNDREKIVISLLGNPKDSSSIVNYTLGELFMRYKLETHPLEAILNSMNPDKKVIVFIDDNIGSGKQAVQIFREWFGIEKRDLNESHVKPLSDEQKEKFKRFRIYLCTFVGFEDGKEYVRVELKKMGLNVVKVYSFLKSEEEIGCFHKALKTFETEEDRVQAENMAREIGVQLFEDKNWPDEVKSKRSLGYGNSQKLIVFYYNTPTSTLPILWKEGRYNGKKWLPLFPRREKK